MYTQAEPPRCERGGGHSASEREHSEDTTPSSLEYQKMTIPLVYVVLLHAWERERDPVTRAHLDAALRAVHAAHVRRLRNR